MQVFSPETLVAKQSPTSAVYVCCIANKASQCTCSGAMTLLKRTNNFALRTFSLDAGLLARFSIRKFLRPVTSTQAFLGFPVSISKC